MPNHNEPNLYFMLRPNQTCQISQKHPTVQNKRNIYISINEHKICISLRPNPFFSNVSPISCTLVSTKIHQPEIF